MQERVVLCCNRTINLGLLALVFLTPLLFTSHLYDSYTLPKVVFLRLLTIVLVVAWLIKAAITNQVSWRKTALDFPILAFWLMCAMSTMFSVNRTLSLFGGYKRYEDFITLTGYCLLYFIVVNHVKEKRQLNQLLTVLLISISIISAYGILQHFGIDFVKVGGQVDLTRSFSTIGNAVFLGSLLTLLLPVAVSRFVSSLTPRGRCFSSVAVVLIFTCLLFTYSRAGWLGFLVAILFWAVFIRKKTLRGNKVWVVSLCLFLILITIFGSSIKSPWLEQTQLVTERAVSSIELGSGSVRTRIVYWQATAQLIVKKPWLGFGPDTMSLVYSRYFSPQFRAVEPGARIDKAHNEFLQVGATTGLLGLTAYLLILLMFFYAAIDSLKAASDDSHCLLVGLVAGCLAYVVSVQFSFSQVEVSSIFWIIMAATIAAGMIQRDRVEATIFLKLSKNKWSRAVRYIFCLAIIGLMVFAYIPTTLKPAIADAYFRKGICAETRGELDSTIVYCEQVVTFNRNRSVYYISLGKSYQAKALAAPKERKIWLEKALAAYAKAEKLDPYNPDFYTNLGNLYYYCGEESKAFYGEAIVAYERSISLDPLAADAYIGLGAAYMQKGLADEAICQLKEAIKRDPKKVMAYLNLGTIYHSRGMVEEALYYLKEARKLDPKNAEVEKALKECRKASSTN